MGRRREGECGKKGNRVFTLFRGCYYGNQGFFERVGTGMRGGRLEVIDIGFDCLLGDTFFYSLLRLSSFLSPFQLFYTLGNPF